MIARAKGTAVMPYTSPTKLYYQIDKESLLIKSLITRTIKTNSFHLIPICTRSYR